MNHLLKFIQPVDGRLPRKQKYQLASKESEQEDREEKVTVAWSRVILA